MQFCQASWEDDEKSREVLFRIEYTIQNGAADVSAITPERVSFLCPESKQTVRSIRIWTDKAKAILVRQYSESGKLAQLIDRLSERDAVAAVA